MNNNQKKTEDKKSQGISSNLLPKQNSDKKTLVLDLDETLVHSQFQPFDNPSDIILKIELENELHDIHVMVRPGVSEFLKNMGKLYEIVIFTASVSKYADPLLDILDKDKNCKYRLFREHCTPIKTCYVKEINKLGRELKNVIIVDNSPMSYALNPENGLPITTWFEDKNDRELYNISSILEFLSFVPDVRNYINQFIINDEISYTNVINVFDKYNKMLTNEKNNDIVNKDSNDIKINNNEKNEDNNNRNDKKIFNKNNSKTKFKSKENINKNIITNNKFKKNLTLNNLKQKEKNEENNKKIVRPISKHNKSKSKPFNPKNFISNIDKSENSENINPNIINQTTKNKMKKNLNFNPSSIIASIPTVSVTNIFHNNYVIPNTTKNGTISKNNNNILRHRKSDSFSGLRIQRKIYEKNSFFNNNFCKNNNTNLLHSKSIIMKNENKKKNLIKNINSYNINSNPINTSTNVHTTKNKTNKNIQLSMRINHDFGQELKKLEQSLQLDEKAQRKLSKSLTKEKITISLSQKNKINTCNYSTNTFSNKSNYIYHKKHKSINSSIIPYPFPSKKTFNKNNVKNEINLNNNHKYSKNTCNNNCKHRRFLSSSDNNGMNMLKGANYIYSTNTTHSNHSSIIGSSNPGNIFLNNLSFKSGQRNSKRKLEINVMRTERIKDKENNNPNINLNIIKKKENKIPFNLNKKRNDANEENNTFRKKIPINDTNKNNLKMNINNNIKKTGFHKKNIGYNSEIAGLISIRPKSTKQANQIKTGKRINYNMDNNKNNIINVNKNNNINIINDKNKVENDNTKITNKEIYVVKA